MGHSRRGLERRYEATSRSDRLKKRLRAIPVPIVGLVNHHEFARTYCLPGVLMCVTTRGTAENSSAGADFSATSAGDNAGYVQVFPEVRGCFSRRPNLERRR